jgi:FdhD protein
MGEEGQGRDPGAQPLTRRGNTARRQVRRVALDERGVSRVTQRHDTVATEEPLEIRVGGEHTEVVPVSVTMRTPGSDFELAAGFLFGEGIVEHGSWIRRVSYCVGGEVRKQNYNAVRVDLAPGIPFDAGRFRRNFYSTSSCGVCGKASIEAVLGPACARVAETVQISPELLLSLPARFRDAQRIFERTGGLHAAALFDGDGTLRDLREDVGRHNAMDKLVGAAVLHGSVPLGGRIVLLSGRLSFELVQKAARAGIELLAGVSAPSSLAVELAEEAGITLVGFLRERGFNIYTAPARIAGSDHGVDHFTERSIG